MVSPFCEATWEGHVYFFQVILYKLNSILEEILWIGLCEMYDKYLVSGIGSAVNAKFVLEQVNV